MKNLLALCLLLLASISSAEIITISGGKIKGQSLGNINRYLGVPYAAPPVDALRWRAPRPAPPWSDIRNAQTPGSACPQIGNFFASNDASTFGKPYGSEDCLYLNVWAPKTTKEALPVLVFFHGGSGIAGDAAHPLYDGERLAKSLNAVVITANYRLGVLGSLQSPALQTGDPAEDSGSFFLLDMIRVLDWTRENCAVLGCASNNITIAGQSAGAVNVLALMRSPLAEGKFQRAISFSGIPFSASMDTAHKRTNTLLKQLFINSGMSATETADHRNSPEQLKTYLYQQSAMSLLKASGRGLSPARVDDGAVLMRLDKPDKPADRVISSVPLMLGTTRNEMTTLMPVKQLGRQAETLWPLYNGEPRKQTINAKIGFTAGITRNIRLGLAEWYVKRKLRRITRAYAKSLPAVYAYSFRWNNYPDPWRTDLGAFHALDLPFIFGNFIDDREAYMRFAWTEENAAERESLHQKISADIRNFIHHSDPGVDQPDSDKWLPWDRREYIKKWDH